MPTPARSPAASVAAPAPNPSSARPTPSRPAGTATRHFIANHVIEPSPGGAIGREYAVIIDIGEGGKPSTILNGATYHDVYVRTPADWRECDQAHVPKRDRRQIFRR